MIFRPTNRRPSDGCLVCGEEEPSIILAGGGESGRAIGRILGAGAAPKRGAQPFEIKRFSGMLWSYTERGPSAPTTGSPCGFSSPSCTRTEA